MGKNNVMSPVELKNHVSRNGFDLSRKICFTGKFGQLLPLMPKFMYPGDKFKCKLEEFTRTLPVNTAAFARMRHYFDFYFVPMRLMWRDFPSFITSMVNTAKQATSIDTNRSVGQQTPYISQLSLTKFVETISKGSSENNKDIFGFNRGENTKRLLQYLGYYHLMKNDLYNNVPLSPFPLLAYQKIYNDYFRYSQWENEQSNTYNIDYLTSGQEVPLSRLGGLDGYTDFEPTLLDLRYCNYNKDMFLGLLPSRQYGAKSMVPLPMTAREERLLSDLPIRFRGFRFPTQPSIDPNVQLPKTATYADSSYYGNDLLLGDNATKAPMTLAVELGSKKGAKSGGYTDNKFIQDLYRNTQISLDILTLRAAEAVQKFREIALSNGQDYKSQIEAHFGVKVSKIVSGLCEYIGGISHDISVNEVVNQNLTANEQADIQGKGIASGDGFVEYEAKEHGVFMCIYHATILPDYEVQGYERDNLRVSFSDFPIPEFDRLGFEPVPAVLLTGEYNKNAGSHNGSVTNEFGEIDYIPIGYAPRYYDLKTSYDILLGGFNSFGGGTLRSWVTPIDPKQLLRTIRYDPSAPYGNSEVQFSSFKINPHVVDPLFSAVADDSLDSDPLHVTCFFDLKAVRNFDRNGMPY